MEIKLYFNGFEKNLALIREHRWGNDRKIAKNALRAEIWARFAIPIQTVSILVETAVFQTFRGLAFLTYGCLMLDSHCLKRGGEELLSTLIQIVVFPLIALSGAILPDLGELILDGFLGLQGSIQENEPTPQGCLWETRLKIACFVVGIFSVPVAAVRAATGFINYLFSFHFEQAGACLALIVKEPLINLGLTLASPCSTDLCMRSFYCFEQDYLQEKNKKGLLPSKELINIWPPEIHVISI